VFCKVIIHTHTPIQYVNRPCMHTSHIFSGLTLSDWLYDVAHLASLFATLTTRNELCFRSGFLSYCSTMVDSFTEHAITYTSKFPSPCWRVYMFYFFGSNCRKLTITCKLPLVILVPAFVASPSTAQAYSSMRLAVPTTKAKMIRYISDTSKSTSTGRTPQ